jgi:hypothetical protein
MISRSNPVTVRCVFSESNMYGADQRDGLSKAGSGRVATYRMTGLTHVYTLECNYNMGRRVNRLVQPHVPASMDQHRSLSPQPPLRCLSPKYGPEMWQAVGKALAISALDMLQANPCSRLGAPGDAMATGFARLRSTATAWVRTNEHKEREKAAKKAAKNMGGNGSDDDDDAAASDGGSDGGEGEHTRAAGPLSKKENDPPLTQKPGTAQSAAAPKVAQEGATDVVAASAHASAAVPYWAIVRGTPLTRKGFSLRTPPAGRLATSSRVLVVSTKPMLDGALRGALALDGRPGAPHCWMTLVMRDGVENATVMTPQPPVGAAGTMCATSLEAEVEPVAESEAKGCMAFVF